MVLVVRKTYLAPVRASLGVAVVHVVAGEAEGLVGAQQAAHHGLGDAAQVAHAGRLGRTRRERVDRPPRSHRFWPDHGWRGWRCRRGADFLVVRLRGLILGYVAAPAGARLLDLQCWKCITL